MKLGDESKMHNLDVFERSVCIKRLYLFNALVINQNLNYYDMQIFLLNIKLRLTMNNFSVNA